MGDDRQYPVEVVVKNSTDLVAKPRLVKNSTFKTYLLDPAGYAPMSPVAGSAPKWLQITDYEPNRIRTVIQVLDNPVSISLEPPVTSPFTSAPDNPVPNGRLLVPTPAFEYEFFGPDALFLTAVQNPSNYVAPNLNGVVEARTLAVAATNAGNFGSFAPGESVACVGVDFQAPGAAVLATITVSAVLGGPYSWVVSVPTTGLSWRWPFTVAVPAQDASSFPVVGVGAIAGGPAYTISAEYLKTTTMSRVTVTREYA